MKIGYTHGRFQPFHNGHLKLLKHMYNEFDEVWIGIANPLRRMPELAHLLKSEAQENLRIRRQPELNFLTYVEIVQTIDKVLRREGMDMSKIKILPQFSHYDLSNWRDFMPKNCTIVKTIKKDYHKEKQSVFEKEGFKVEHFVDSKPHYSNFFKEWPNGNWKEIVPEEAINILEKHK